MFRMSIRRMNTQVEYDYIFKLIFVGDCNVGKTSLFFRFFEDVFYHKYIPTVGVDYRHRLIDVNGKRVKLIVWDSAGQERFRAVTKQYYKGSHGVFIVFDVGDASSLENSRYWMDEVNSSVGRNAEVLLVGNKCDVTARIIDSMMGRWMADQLGVDYFEVSAKNDINVSAMFVAVASRILMRVERVMGESTMLMDEQRLLGKSEAGCCGSRKRIACGEAED